MTRANKTSISSNTDDVIVGTCTEMIWKTAKPLEDRWQESSESEVSAHEKLLDVLVSDVNEAERSAIIDRHPIHEALVKP